MLEDEKNKDSFADDEGKFGEDDDFGLPNVNYDDFDSESPDSAESDSGTPDGSDALSSPPDEGLSEGGGETADPFADSGSMDFGASEGGGQDAAGEESYSDYGEAPAGGSGSVFGVDDFSQTGTYDSDYGEQIGEAGVGDDNYLSPAGATSKPGRKKKGGGNVFFKVVLYGVILFTVLGATLFFYGQYATIDADWVPRPLVVYLNKYMSKYSGKEIFVVDGQEVADKSTPSTSQGESEFSGEQPKGDSPVEGETPSDSGATGEVSESDPRDVASSRPTGGGFGEASGVEEFPGEPSDIVGPLTLLGLFRQGSGSEVPAPQEVSESSSGAVAAAGSSRSSRTASTTTGTSRATRQTSTRQASSTKPSAASATGDGNSLVTGRVANLGSRTGKTYIVIASFQDQANASVFADGILRKGGTAAVISPFEGSPYFRVAAGEFSTHRQAASNLPSFRSRYGSDAWVLRF